MRNIFFILLLTCFALRSSAQKDSLLRITLDKIITGNIVDFTTDNLGNIYIVNGSNQIKKLSGKGDSIAVYNDVKRYGKIFNIDATNPLKVLVYYKDFATIVVLDRLLNVRNTIDLRKQNIFQVQAVTTSYDGNIWLFDELESKLKKIDDYGKTLLETADFRLVFDAVPQPEVIYDRDGQLYLYDRNKGLLVFDYYGAQKNNYQLKGINNLQVIDKNTITGRDSSRIVLYKPLTLQLLNFRLSENLERFSRVRFDGNKVYALTNGGNVETYLTP